MKGLRIGRRRARATELPGSPLELALRPAIVEGRWQVPDRFNFTRDVVEALARDPKRRALTFLGKDGVIEPRTFHEISEGATVWAATLTERGIGAGDRVARGLGKHRGLARGRPRRHEDRRRRRSVHADGVGRRCSSGRCR